MLNLPRGRYEARLAESRSDQDAALALRALCFRNGQSPDEDDFDGICRHVLVEEVRSGRLVCTYRLLPLRAGERRPLLTRRGRHRRRGRRAGAARGGARS